MGIDNIHILIDPDAQVSQVRATRKANVSQHIIRNDNAKRRYVFGWDQPLQSFYLQVHDLGRAKDDRIVAWLGADKHTIMYEVEELVAKAQQYGLDIPRATQVNLYQEKDDGE
jgi:hypothetical protein